MNSKNLLAPNVETQTVVSMSWQDKRLIEIQKQLEGLEIVAYQGIKSLFTPHRIIIYNCITKGRGANPYRLGAIDPEISHILVDAIEREYQMKNRTCWMQNTDGTQSTGWVWKNESERSRFNEWYGAKFGIEVEINDPEQITLF